MGTKLTKQVKRKNKKYSKFLERAMVVLAVISVLFGIVMDRGMMFIAMLFAVLYWIASLQNDKEYEYNFENGILTIDVIKGKRRRKRVHELDMKNLEVVAPNWHEAVKKYRKNGGTEKLPKFDYTSYDDEIPFYTMIIVEGNSKNNRKIKLLLDLDRDMLDVLKRLYSQKVYLNEKG